MSRIRIPGLIDVLRVDECDADRGAGRAIRGWTAHYAPRGPLVNRIILKRIRRVLAIDGVPLPPVAPRGRDAAAAEPEGDRGVARRAGRTSGFGRARISRRWRRGCGAQRPGRSGRCCSRRSAGCSRPIIAPTRRAGRRRRVLGRAPSDFNPLHMLLWGITHRVERARALLAGQGGRRSRPGCTRRAWRSTTWSPGWRR